MFSHVSGTQKMLCPRGEAWLARLEGKVTCKPSAAQQDGGGEGLLRGHAGSPAGRDLTAGLFLRA